MSAHGFAVLSDLSKYAQQKRIKVITTKGRIVTILGKNLVPGILKFKYVAVLA